MKTMREYEAASEEEQKAFWDGILQEWQRNYAKEESDYLAFDYQLERRAWVDEAPELYRSRPETTVIAKARHMNINEVYGNGNWLKAADLQGQKHRVKISDWDMTAFKNNDGSVRNQVVLSFEGKEKKLGLNVTNSRMIASMHGEDTEGWIGKEIVLCPQKTMNQMGQLVDCIRIEYESKPAKAKVVQNGSTRATPKAAIKRMDGPIQDGPPLEAYDPDDMNDSVPF